MRTDRAIRTRIDLAFGTRLVVASLILVFLGCLSNYGRFTLDTRVDRTFRDGESLPEYNYYYAGRDTMPYAIIGIERGYAVPSSYWIPFDPQPALLKKMSENIYHEVWDEPYGAHILNPAGKVIGVWYSNVFNKSVRVDPDNRSVEVLFKNPENDDRPMGFQ